MTTNPNKYTIIENTSYGKIRYFWDKEERILQQKVTEKFSTYENGEIIAGGYRSRWEKVDYEE